MIQKVRFNKVLGCITDQSGSPVQVLIGNDCKGNGVLYHLGTGEVSPVLPIENHRTLHPISKCTVDVLSDIYQIQKKSPHIYSGYLKLLNTKFDKYFQR